MITVTRTGDTFHLTDLSKEEFVALYEFLNDENDLSAPRVVVDEYLRARSCLIEEVEDALFTEYLKVVEEEEDENGCRWDA